MIRVHLVKIGAGVLHEVHADGVHKVGGKIGVALKARPLTVDGASIEMTHGSTYEV